MFGLSLGHLVVLFVVVLLFGSRRLPELGGALGKGIRAFKSGLEGRPEGQPSALPETTRVADSTRPQANGPTSS